MTLSLTGNTNTCGLYFEQKDSRQCYVTKLKKTETCVKGASRMAQPILVAMCTKTFV